MIINPADGLDPQPLVELGGNFTLVIDMQNCADDPDYSGVLNLGLQGVNQQVFHHTHCVPLVNAHSWRQQTMANLADFAEHRGVFSGWAIVDGAPVLQNLFGADGKLSIPRRGGAARIFKKLYDPKHWITTFLSLLCDPVRGVDVTFMGFALGFPELLKGDLDFLVAYLGCKFGSAELIQEFLGEPVRNQILAKFATEERRDEFGHFFELLGKFAKLTLQNQPMPPNAYGMVKGILAFVRKIRSPTPSTQATLTKIDKGLDSLRCFIQQKNPSNSSLISSYEAEKYFLTTCSPFAREIVHNVLSGAGGEPMEITPGFKIVREYVVTQNLF
jgi:hypothetical protein